MIIRPTLRSLLIAIAFIKAHVATLCITCIALHTEGKPKAENPVVRKPNLEKSFCAQNAEGGKVLSCGKPKARYDLAVLKSQRQPKKSLVARNAEGSESTVA